MIPNIKFGVFALSIDTRVYKIVGLDDHDRLVN